MSKKGSETMIKQFSIEFIRSTSEYKIARYILPTGKVVLFDEKRGEIDLSHLKHYVGKKFDAFVNDQYDKSYKLLDVFNTNDENNNEVMAIKYE